MKSSLRIKLLVFISLIIAVTIGLCVFMNRAFLERFYTGKKKQALKSTFNTLNNGIREISDNTLSADQRSVLDKSEFSENVQIYLFADIEKQTEFGTLYFTYFIYPQTISVADRDDEQPGMRADNRELTRIMETYAHYIFPRQNASIQEVETLESTDRYKIMRQHNASLDSDFIDIYGQLDCGYICLVRVAVESIGEAVHIANRFLYMTGTMMFFIAVIISIIAGRRFTKPIIELSGIAKRMSKLDFNAKYIGQTCDEIGVLGESMNSLSNTLEKTISELKSANIELTKDIQQKEEVDRMRTEFISNVTHELKTPIALIQGYAEGLKDCVNDDPESREFYCDVITDEAGKMNQMVQKLLSLSKIESGVIPLDIVHFSLNDIICSVLSANEILFKKADVKLEFEPSDSACIWADEYMTEEVVSNYVSNALHHVAGDMIIRIKTERVGETVRLSVFNTGSPIPEESLDQIWTKFYKVDKARTREYGGTGIGLSIVRAIMDAHHKNYGVINHEDGVEFFDEFDCSNDC
ncbi:MAG: HAMP domain-containing protein [Lachnospiraceae bacterium]|nr:HAMP domain-containing protein [Lachnospiraceae bacterium]